MKYPPRFYIEINFILPLDRFVNDVIGKIPAV